MKYKSLYIMFAFLILIALGSERSFAAKYANSHFMVETDWLSEHLNDPGLRILDVRKIADYELGHIPNAIHLDRNEIDAVVEGVGGMLAPAENIEKALGKIGISNESKIVIYDHLTGTSAARVFWILDYIGHKNMALLNGGWMKWNREKREVTRKIHEVEGSLYKSFPDANKLATGPWILENLKNHDVAILDVRSHDEFTGKVARSARGGHIPGAIHYEWTKSLTGQGTVKSATDLRNMLYKEQIKKGKEIVVYCQTGRRGAHGYFILRLLGYDKIRLYDGSWAEWGNDDRYPVESGVGKSIHKSAPTC